MLILLFLHGQAFRVEIVGKITARGARNTRTIASLGRLFMRITVLDARKTVSVIRS